LKVLKPSQVLRWPKKKRKSQQQKQGKTKL